MSFLAPLFLVGALAIAAPIIFHLIRRTTREKQLFSSLMFLQPTPPRVTRRSRLENIFLLLLRCLVLFLLAVGFSRPFFSRPVADEDHSTGVRHTVLLIDTSASMKRAGFWQAATDLAAKHVRAADASERIAILAFDRDVRPVITFEQWSSMAAGDRVSFALKQLQQLKPGWGATALDQAVLAAVEAIEEDEAQEKTAAHAGQRTVQLISDLQEGSRVSGLQAFEWPPGIEFRVEPIKPARPTNAGLQLVTDLSANAEGEKAVRVRVSNSADAKHEQFQVGWARAGQGFLGAPVDVYVPPGQSRVIPLPATPAGLPEERLQLAGDDESFDNAAYLVPPSTEPVNIFYLGDDAPGDAEQSLYYVQRAFQEIPGQRTKVLGRRLDAPLFSSETTKAALLIVNGKPGESQLNAVKEALQAGGTVLFVLRTPDDSSVLARLAGVGSLPCSESTGREYSLLGQIDFEHPLFKPFADPRYSDFARIVFWKHRTLEFKDLPDGKSLARFDNGDAALVQAKAGQGTLFVLTSGWHPADSQLALSTKFVPLLYSLLAFTGNLPDSAPRLIVGDTITFAGTDATRRASVRKPDGSVVEVATAFFPDTDQAGIYTATLGSTTLRYAVNMDPAESRTSALPVEELIRLGVPVTEEQTARKPSLAARQQLLNAELESRQKLWRWLIVAALVVLLMETWVSGRLTQQPVAAE